MNIHDVCTKDLQRLCIDIIDKLDELRQKGLTTNEEYIVYTKLKQQFLTDTGHHSLKDKEH